MCSTSLWAIFSLASSSSFYGVDLVEKLFSLDVRLTWGDFLLGSTNLLFQLYLTEGDFGDFAASLSG